MYRISTTQILKSPQSTPSTVMFVLHGRRMVTFCGRAAVTSQLQGSFACKHRTHRTHHPHPLPPPPPPPYECTVHLQAAAAHKPLPSCTMYVASNSVESGTVYDMLVAHDQLENVQSDKSGKSGISD